MLILIFIVELYFLKIWIFDPDYTPRKLTIADTARIVNAQIIGKKLYLLNTIGKLYSSNFDNFELNLIDSNVSDIFTYFDEILYLKENKLISISSTEVMKELTQFEKPVSRLKIKSNYIVAYSDSSYMYKYDYDKNFIEDLSTVPNSLSDGGYCCMERLR